MTDLRYEIRKQSSGRYFLRDTITGTLVHRKWPQHRHLRTWATKAAARRVADALELEAEIRRSPPPKDGG